MLAWLCLMWIWLSVKHCWCKSDKPNCVGLTKFYCILGYGWSLLVFLIPWGNHAQLEHGSVAERSKSTFAYGWVERCSNIDGCTTSFSKDKYSCLFKFCNCIFLWIIMKLSWTCWMYEYVEWMIFFHCIYHVHLIMHMCIYML